MYLTGRQVCQPDVCYEPRVDAPSLERAAVEATGLDDFGDPGYREGLTVLVGALDAEAQLSPVGEMALTAQITAALSNRLRVVDWRRRHPEVGATRVEAPLVVLGLPRTGTTLLGGLLACDPTHRPLYRWEANDCIPPPEADALTTDPRVEATRHGSQVLDSLNPGFKAIHHEEADDPTECVTVLGQHFTSLLWETLANVGSYGEWLLRADQRTAYRYHHDVLEVLQSRAPGRWSLKSPHHGLALDALLAEYPDARVVITHRDPVPVIGSLCSLIRSLSGTFSDADHTAYIATHWPAIAEEIVTRTDAVRQTHSQRGFLDVAYRDLLNDPIETVRAIYVWDDHELHPDTEAEMRAYLASHAQARFGRHTYALDDFGLRAGAVRERFADYVERHAIAPEGPPD